jgi:ferredoxin
MKYLVDAALCCGHGMCFKVSPDAFGSDADGFNKDAGNVVEVGDELEVAVERGASACPEQAIVLIGNDTDLE